MKLKVYLEKQVQKAIDHLDEHPLSGSANRAVKEAQAALHTYMEEVRRHEEQLEKSVSSYEDMEGNYCNLVNH